MDAKAIIVAKRLGRLNSSTVDNYITVSIDDRGSKLTVSDTTVSFDTATATPAIPANSLVKKALVTQNKCEKGVIKPKLLFSSTYAMQGPAWEVSGYPDGWHSVIVIYTRHYDFVEGSQAAILGTISADTIKGSVISYNWQGTNKFYARTSSLTLTMLPHQDLAGTEWREAQYTDWDGFAELIINRSGASTMVGEIGLQQVFLTSGTQMKIDDLAIKEASCASCCDEYIMEHSILSVRLAAARNLFCRGRFVEAVRVLESVYLGCEKIEKCDCC